MMSKDSSDSLAGPLLSWAIGLTVLVLTLGVGLVKYCDLAAVLGRVR
jgi:hypothetical protein